MCDQESGAREETTPWEFVELNVWLHAKRLRDNMAVEELGNP